MRVWWRNSSTLQVRWGQEKLQEGRVGEAKFLGDVNKPVTQELLMDFQYKMTFLWATELLFKLSSETEIP